ncbi:MAG: glycosyltransferase family 4 protein [Treponema sp.]|nr:glycosyltransferase family 4 protein [Treponema sp.]MBP3606868.1 glycosyltransferase family 4 protein [Treponema sp.]
MSKIIIIIDNITKRAGTERAVVNLSNILAKQGQSVCVLSIQSVEGAPAYSIDSSVTIKHFERPDIGSYFPIAKNRITIILKKISFFLVLNKLIKKEKCEIVIGTTTFINFLIRFLPKKIKTIGCEHFNSYICSKKQMFLRKLLYKKLNAVVLLTENDKNNYGKMKNLYVIPNSLSFIPSKLSDCKNKKMISLGRFSYQKGYDLLIDCIALVKDNLLDWTIELYGDGSDKEKLLNKINENGLDRIIYLKDNTTDVESVYASSSIYLSSSRYEGLPMVLIESQSCGLPAVSFDCPYGPSYIIIEGKTGFLVPLGDVKKMSEKILELINNEDLRIQMGKQAAIESSRFSEDKISEMWKILLERI